MTRHVTLLIAATAVTLLASPPLRVLAGAPEGARVITVAFGPGLNTLPPTGPSGPENHHVVPKRIEIEVGDTVNFVVAGFHQIRIFEPGVDVADVVEQLPVECRTNPLPPSCAASGFAPVIPLDSPLDSDLEPDLQVYYEGVPAVSTPLAVTTNTTTGNFQVVLPTRSAAQNRAETVSFTKRGRYLVICAILPHFNDRMVAWIHVGRSNEGADHRDEHAR
jgi:plastocyanin